MVIESFIPPEEITKLRSLLQSDESKPLPFSEICYGKLLLIGGPGCDNCIYIDNLPLLEFFAAIQTFLRQNKSVNHASETLMDANQTYCLEVSKDKDQLTITTTVNQAPCMFTGKYSHVKSRMEFAINKFFVDLLYFCPEFESSRYMDEARRVFYVNVL